VAGAAAAACAVCDVAQACCLVIAQVENTDPDPCRTFAAATCSSFAGDAQAAVLNACERYLQQKAGTPGCK
jgi:hypothetical protein